MKRNLPLLALVGLLTVAALMLTLWQDSRPTGDHELKTITVEVLHKDQSTNTFTYETDAAFLGEVLLEEGLISGSQGPYGLFVDTVDGETADYTVDGSWWQLTCSGEAASSGADAVALEDGGLYGWVYTVGE